MKLQKFDLLVALYIFGVMVAELMGSKTFTLVHFGHTTLTASVAIFVMPLLFTATDVIVEVKGRERARSVVFSGLITVLLLMGFAVLATHLAPSARFAGQEAAYDSVFGASARIALASVLAFAASEFLDVAVFSKLRQRLHGQALWLRNNVSNIVSQFVDSTVFIVVAFYVFGASLGVNLGFLSGIILPYWLIRCALSAVETPLVYIGAAWLRGSKTKPVTADAAETTA